MIKVSSVISILPTTGKFYFSKFSDSNCKNSLNVRLVNPTGACWSTKYDNGIKPVAYDEVSLKLSIQIYDTSSCYGTSFKTQDVKCDDTECVVNPASEDEYFKCTYLAYPAKANFTLSKYTDNECLKQDGIIVMKGDSNCWNLPEKGSLSPVNLVDIQELSYYYYPNDICTGLVTLNTIKCDNTCFKSPNGENQYFRCKYLSGNYLSIRIIFVISLIVFLF